MTRTPVLGTGVTQHCCNWLHTRLVGVASYSAHSSYGGDKSHSRQEPDMSFFMTSTSNLTSCVSKIKQGGFLTKLKEHGWKSTPIWGRGTVLECMASMAKSPSLNHSINTQNSQLHGHRWPPGPHLPPQTETKVTATVL